MEVIEKWLYARNAVKRLKQYASHADAVKNAAHVQLMNQLQKSVQHAEMNVKKYAQHAADAKTAVTAIWTLKVLMKRNRC